MEKPIVSIIGTPNVGKSTLFNKIVGKKISITEDTPGVTRDRIYSDATWLNKQFLLVDTGGLDLKDEDIFMSSIKAQVDLALDMSDVIIFLTDGIKGVSSNDLEISNYLRKSNKKIILAVNKFDSKDAKNNYYDFFELGLGTPITISSEQGSGVGDLLDEVIVDFKDQEDDFFDDDIRVTFIGKPNVGKSSLINRILGEERVIVTDIPGTTRDAIDSKFNFNGENYVFVDTAGLRKKKKIYENIERYSVIRTLTAIERASVCVLVIDAYEGVSEQDSKIVGYAHDNNKAIIVAVNKWDLIEKDNSTMKKFESDIRKRLPFINYAPILFISAQTGQRVDKLLEMISLVNNNYNHRIKTGVLNDILNRAVLMNQPPSDKGKRGKLYYGSQVSVRPPKFLISVNDKDLFHFSYVRYLENQIRDAYSFDGVPLVLLLKNRGERE
ncbi:ribosome biogenesis GTPase Der [Peptoniphilus sp. oral taxon 386]|uniref:ribosome biogenesis GTPase Der n=1 Tax=Peptoniphilus sp. oral taxon 386 TaxID=652713 RepID=UPI0001DA9B43|nr:ribosome biogenesis GTPase Der [Peptoniphilus sp. oral taxon 386]EFI42316.1 ribosome biogenesis GTPase Der [Peptoniphilus sp. oral taxon 386 str. F0131]